MVLAVGILIMVDFLLLSAGSRLCGVPSDWRRIFAASVLGGGYGAVCMSMPEFGTGFLRLAFLIILGGVAYGVRKHAWSRTAVFLMLSLALNGMTENHHSLWVLILSGFLLLCLCVLAGGIPCGKMVQVVLPCGGRELKILALQDTGNTLKDPITGGQVLIVDPEIARQLAGLTPAQLAAPVESLHSLPGLRLIPYHTIAQHSGMMLAMSVRCVQIGKWKGTSLVAFSPGKISDDGSYQALTGGVLG